MKRANLEIKTIVKYFEANKLLISWAKCSFMITKPRPRMKIDEPELFMGDQKIKRVSSMKFLGVTVLSKMI